MDASLMETYTAILREELIPAMGCRADRDRALRGEAAQPARP